MDLTKAPSAKRRSETKTNMHCATLKFGIDGAQRTSNTSTPNDAIENSFRPGLESSKNPASNTSTLTILPAATTGVRRAKSDQAMAQEKKMTPPSPPVLRSRSAQNTPRPAAAGSTEPQSLVAKNITSALTDTVLSRPQIPKSAKTRSPPDASKSIQNRLNIICSPNRSTDVSRDGSVSGQAKRIMLNTPRQQHKNASAGDAGEQAISHRRPKKNGRLYW